MQSQLTTIPETLGLALRFKEPGIPSCDKLKLQVTSENYKLILPVKS